MEQREKIFDWKGNEVKEGMTIYFVQQKPGIISSSRFGLLIPQTGETIWEDEESWNKRKNEDIWELGRPYEVTEVDGLLRMTRHDEDGYSFSFPLIPADNICIKGISDKKRKDMKVIHDLPKEVIDTIVKLGVIVDEPDARYYNLPQWFKKDDNGVVTEVLFKELPDSVKHIHLSYRDYQRVFSLEEMKNCWEAGLVNGWDNSTHGHAEPSQKTYFKEKFNIDL